MSRRSKVYKAAEAQINGTVALAITMIIGAAFMTPRQRRKYFGTKK